MAEDVPSVASIIGQLPQRLQRRFESLGSYVRGLIYEESTRSDAEVNLSADDVRFIQLAALIYLLDRFFRVGSGAARSAATTFEEFGFFGFQVGSSTFTRDNYDTRRGELLADRLQEAIRGTRLEDLVRDADSMRDLVSTMIREMNDG